MVTATEPVGKEKKVMVKGRRPKAKASATRTERAEKVRQAIVDLPDKLREQGFSSQMPKPTAIKTISEPMLDPKTSGWIGHVEEPLGILLQRVSVKDNFSQRPPFTHVTDSIYARLIRDFISGAAMPESKIAALGPANSMVKSLTERDIYYSIIDGLQRQYCYGLAVLLVWRREENISDGLMTSEAWESFAQVVEASGDPISATAELLERTMRYEVFYNIDLGSLLHYMVTFNTAQRRMSLNVQLEIMRKPLLEELEAAGIPIYHDRESLPGTQVPKEQFGASNLIIAMQTFITNNPQITAGAEAERILNTDQPYLDNVGDISDVAQTFKRIALDLHTQILGAYPNDPARRYILSNQTFLSGLCAACGYVRNRINMKSLDGALDKLLEHSKRPGEDPLNLEEYFEASASITTSRGKAMRRLVYDTFLRFFNGATTELEWMDTARQITGNA